MVVEVVVVTSTRAATASLIFRVRGVARGGGGGGGACACGGEIWHIHTRLKAPPTQLPHRHIANMYLNPLDVAMNEAEYPVEFEPARERLKDCFVLLPCLPQQLLAHAP